MCGLLFACVGEAEDLCYSTLGGVESHCLNEIM